jgi:hypothetical protein
MESPDYNRFLTLQLKIQKAHNGFEITLLSPIEFEAVAYLTYDLRQYVLKPIGVCPAFDSIMIPIPSITSMTTSELTSASGSILQVHLRLTLPPFAVSLGFPRDCQSFGIFIESIEFLQLTLNPPQFSLPHREIQELRELNGELNNTLKLLKSTKAQQEQVIQELSQLLVTANHD